MLSTLAHRGPDGQGAFLDPGIGIGMRRLAVRDVALGRQPYVSEDGRVVAVFNGELYNYPHLRTDVLTRGHQLRSGADGEVLVHLYEEYGLGLLDKISGMFALALWDRQSRELFLARDRIGQKPLYMLQSSGMWAFASEMKAFLGVNGFEPQVDTRYLSSYLAHRFVPAPHTLWVDVEKLQPGEAMRIGPDGRMKRWKYWELQARQPESQGQLNDWAERLDTLLSEAVSSHLAADVPVGLFLSGGLDSSLLAALASQSTRGQIEAWSATFPRSYADRDDESWARTVADRYGLLLHRVDVDQQMTAERVRELAYVLDEPMADPTVLPLDGVARAASEQCTVMLSGEGADEIFGGYAGYGEVDSLRWLAHIPSGLRAWWAERGLLGHGAMRRTLQPVADRYRGVGFTFSPDEVRSLLVDDLAYPDRPRVVQTYWDAARRLPDLQSMQGFDIRWFLPDDVLLKADRVGMHHNLEIRVPYCDHEVVELALSIPLALRRRGRLDKRVLRRVAQRYLPGPVAMRPKKGFPTPLSALMAGRFYDLAYDVLTSQTFIDRGWFRRQGVEALLANLAFKHPPSARRVYALLMLELWTEAMVDRFRPLRARARDLSRGVVQNPRG